MTSVLGARPPPTPLDDFVFQGRREGEEDHRERHVFPALSFLSRSLGHMEKRIASRRSLGS